MPALDHFSRMGANIRVFIGSSTKALPAAHALAKELGEYVEVTVWDSAFASGDILIQALLDAARTHDFGVFIFAPDDTLEGDTRSQKITRDNVLFELGIFMGASGSGHAIYTCLQSGNRKNKVRIPSDLAGVLRAKNIKKSGKNSYEVKSTAKDLIATFSRNGPAVKNLFNEIQILRETLDDRRLNLESKSTKEVWLGKVVEEAARKRTKRWTRNSKPMELMKPISQNFTDEITDEAYWWLIVEGVLKFSDIEYFTNDESWDWDDSISYAELSERGVALLNSYRADPS